VAVVRVTSCSPEGAYCGGDAGAVATFELSQYPRWIKIRVGYSYLLAGPNAQA
jgi:hypothetical protein